ncbi:GGDEF domain-containing protein, partial [Telluria sp. Tellsp104]
TTAGGLRRPADLAARYGGEELVLLLPDTDIVQARHVVDEICAAIAALDMPHAASQVAPVLTVSVGGATLGGHGPESAAELFEAADEHLYRAKQEGRNRVVWRNPVGG